MLKPHPINIIIPSLRAHRCQTLPLPARPRTLTSSPLHHHLLAHCHPPSSLSPSQRLIAPLSPSTPSDYFATATNVQTPASKDLIQSLLKFRNSRSTDLRQLERLQKLVCLLKENPGISAEVWRDGLVPVLAEMSESGPIELEQPARLILSLVGYAPPYRGHGVRILSLDGGGTRYLVKSGVGDIVCNSTVYYVHPVCVRMYVNYMWYFCMALIPITREVYLST